MFKTKFQASKGTEIPHASGVFYEKSIIIAVLQIKTMEAQRNNVNSQRAKG